MCKTSRGHCHLLLLLVSAICSCQPPTPRPEGKLAPTPAISGDFSLKLIGGWRLNQPYCKGGLAIDFATQRAWTLGHAQTCHLVGYNLPKMGEGGNPALWPEVKVARDYGQPYNVSNWNSAHGRGLYAAGLMWREGLLWMSGRGFYSSG